MTNYTEQVNNTVDQMILFNEIASVYPDYMEDMIIQHNDNLVMPDIDDDLISDELMEALDEAFAFNDDFYQMFMVTLKGGYDEEAKKLGIFYHEGQYFLPVTHFGASWDYVQPVDFTAVDMDTFKSVVNDCVK